jgi:hypothetical protein
MDYHFHIAETSDRSYSRPMAPTEAEVRAALSSLSVDGLSFRLVTMDPVTVAVDFVGVECDDCVLAPAELRDVVVSALQRRLPGLGAVHVRDQRTAVTGGTITVVDPTVEVDAGADDPGPAAGSLRGRTVGFRVDILWRSWDWLTEEWESRLRSSCGASVQRYRRAQGLAGDEGAANEAEFRAFVGSVDVAVVGMANCGSCTSWTVKDSVAAARAGLPTVAGATAEFVPLARTLARRYGRPGLRVLELPYPLDTRPEDEVRAIARDTFPRLLEVLGATP